MAKEYLYKVSVEPANGYRSFEKKAKPYYVVATDKQQAASKIHLVDGWKVCKVTLLAEKYSNNLYRSNT